MAIPDGIEDDVSKAVGQYSRGEYVVTFSRKEFEQQVRCDHAQGDEVERWLRSWFLAHPLSQKTIEKVSRAYDKSDEEPFGARAFIEAVVSDEIDELGRRDVAAFLIVKAAKDIGSDDVTVSPSTQT
jgi:hypothetical protein